MQEWILIHKADSLKMKVINHEKVTLHPLQNLILISKLPPCPSIFNFSSRLLEERAVCFEYIFIKSFIKYRCLYAYVKLKLLCSLYISKIKVFNNKIVILLRKEI